MSNDGIKKFGTLGELIIHELKETEKEFGPLKLPCSWQVAKSNIQELAPNDRCFASPDVIEKLGGLMSFDPASKDSFSALRLQECEHLPPGTAMFLPNRLTIDSSDSLTDFLNTYRAELTKSLEMPRSLLDLSMYQNYSMPRVIDPRALISNYDDRIDGADALAYLLSGAEIFAQNYEYWNARRTRQIEQKNNRAAKLRRQIKTCSKSRRQRLVNKLRKLEKRR